MNLCVGSRSSEDSLDEAVKLSKGEVVAQTGFMHESFLLHVLDDLEDVGPMYDAPQCFVRNG